MYQHRSILFGVDLNLNGGGTLEVADAGIMLINACINPTCIFFLVSKRRQIGQARSLDIAQQPTSQRSGAHTEQSVCWGGAVATPSQAGPSKYYASLRKEEPQCFMCDPPSLTLLR